MMAVMRKVMQIVIAVGLVRNDLLQKPGQKPERIQAEAFNRLNSHVLRPDGTEAHAALQRRRCQIKLERQLEAPLRIAIGEPFDRRPQRSHDARVLGFASFHLLCEGLRG